MPSPKNGKAGAAVSPTDPKRAQEADQADPGEVQKLKAGQRQSQSGKYGSASDSAKPHKPPQTPEEKQRKTSWIEIELVDEDNQPVPGEKYRITLPDETFAEGTLDTKGFARVDGIEPGNCRITFPDLHRDAWKRA